MTSRAASVLALLLLVAAPPAGAERAQPVRNVLLVSIDSLRADRLGSYGSPHPASPTIDRLAAEGVRFDQALSPTSWTLPAHATLLSGQWQRIHQVLTTADHLGPGTEMLAEVFARRGYETVGFYSGPFLDPAYGFGRGFESYQSCLSSTTARLSGEAAWESSHGDRTNTCLGDSFVRWAGGRSARPFFVFVHMWDVHYDYIPPEPFASMFDPGYDGPLNGQDILGKGFPLDARPRDVAHLLALYDGELRFTDTTLARMLDALEQAKVLDRTLIVITADHGEEFLDHGGKGHQQTLWNEVLHVPLVLWARTGLPRTVVPEPVSLADVAPTIVELAGLPALAKANGRSLVPLMHGRTETAHIVYGALYHPRVPRLRLATVRDGSIKMLYDEKTGSWTQYDLASDPQEKHPLPPTDEPLRAVLATYIERNESALAARPAPSGASTPAGLAPANVNRLRSLGYVQ
jgi:arylsulfatase A-like enzyme